MEDVVIFSDSTCDLNKELIEKLKIQIIPLYVNFGDDVYRDGIDITTKEMYERVALEGVLPTTATASMVDYYKAFKKHIDLGKKILYIGLGSTFSVTFNNAFLASQELPEGSVTLIDSYNISTGTGIAILLAHEMLLQGKSLQEIKDTITENVDNIKCKFAIESLDYLHKGGRCSAVSKFVGTLFKIKPIIESKDGKLDIYTKTKGKAKAIDTMIKDIVSNKAKLYLKDVMITHTYADDEAIFIKDKLLEKIPDIENIHINDAGCVISSHCGPGTIGIIYFAKKL